MGSTGKFRSLYPLLDFWLLLFATPVISYHRQQAKSSSSHKHTLFSVFSPVVQIKYKGYTNITINHKTQGLDRNVGTSLQEDSEIRKDPVIGILHVILLVIGFVFLFCFKQELENGRELDFCKSVRSVLVCWREWRVMLFILSDWNYLWDCEKAINTLNLSYFISLKKRFGIRCSILFKLYNFIKIFLCYKIGSDMIGNNKKSLAFKKSVGSPVPL